MDKMLALAVEHLANYLEVFFSTLRSPGNALQALTTPVDKVTMLDGDFAETQYQRKLSAGAVSFLLISIFIGSVLNANIVRRLAAPDLILTVVVVIVLWIVLSSFIYVICKLLGGQGSFTQSLSASLQVFAVSYVLCSCVAFLWGIFSIKIMSFGTSPSGFVLRLVQEPILTYFLSQLVLTAVYLTLAMRRVHGFARRSLCGAWSYLEPIAFSIIFLVLTFGIVSLSKSTYDVHRIPLTYPESQFNNFEPGQLVFFNSGNLTHVGVVADENGFYQKSRRHGIVYSEFNEYWMKRIKSFKRISGGCQQVLGPGELEFGICVTLGKTESKCAGYSFETWKCGTESVLFADVVGTQIYAARKTNEVISDNSLYPRQRRIKDTLLINPRNGLEHS
jgi:hypothetical protein